MSTADTASLVLAFLDSLRSGIQGRLPESCSFMHVKALDAISRMDMPSMSEIAAGLNITSPGATLVVDKLSESGELERIHDPKDRRVVRLKITSKGKATLKRGMKEIRSIIGEKMSLLSEEDGQLLADLLKKLI